MTGSLLEPADYALAVGGLVASVAAGFVVGAIPERAAVIDLATNVVPSVVMLVGLVFIVLGRRHYAGQVARALTVVGIATAILMISWIPHFVWHVTGMAPFLSISPGFWLAFFHVLTAGSFVIYLYGFYLFDTAGNPDLEVDDTMAPSEPSETTE